MFDFDNYSSLQVVYCDECSEHEEFNTDEFIDVVHDIKDLGWKIFKENEEWKHVCPDCHDELAKGFRRGCNDIEF